MGKEMPKTYEAIVFPCKKGHPLRLWMFNVFVDLEVLELDASLIIQRIFKLTAYPEKMDPNRPVTSLDQLYPQQDPIVQFFAKNAIQVAPNTAYVVECLSGFCKKRKLNLGDRFPYSFHQPIVD